jgi:hypothetical protein
VTYCDFTIFTSSFFLCSRKNKNEDTLKHLLRTVPEQGVKYELKLCIDQLVSSLWFILIAVISGGKCSSEKPAWQCRVCSGSV